MTSSLNALPSQIPGTVYYRVFHHYDSTSTTTSSSSSLNQGYSLMIDSIFENQAALSVYAPHPAHQSSISNYIIPIRQDNLVVDYELPTSFNLENFIDYQSKSDYLRHFVLLKPKIDSYNTAEWNNKVKSLHSLADEIPCILNTMTGRQDSGNMYSGYADRSKGYKEIVEMVMKPVESIHDYYSHPAHIEVVKGFQGILEEVFCFDYVCGKGSGTGRDGNSNSNTQQ